MMDLTETFRLHRLWLDGDDAGRRANLSRANLSGANLSGANLSGADLSRADLHKADLCGANLSGADLCGADLCGANLSGANLSGADLSYADLSRADLSRADLCGAYLRKVNLSEADLREADLRKADLCDCNFHGAHITYRGKTMTVRFEAKDAPQARGHGMSCEQLPILARCPCCASQVALDDPEAHTRRVGYCIECERCYLRMWAFVGETPTALAHRWNTRPVAADLLAACKKFKRWLAFELSGQPPKSNPRWEAILRDLRAAIAKAEPNQDAPASDGSGAAEG